MKLDIGFEGLIQENKRWTIITFVVRKIDEGNVWIIHLGFLMICMDILID